MPQSAITVSNTFAGDSGNVPASQLDTNFLQPVSALNSINQYNTYLVDSGSVNNIVVSLPSGLTFTLVAGAELEVVPAFTNTSTTVNLNVGATGNLIVQVPAQTTVPIGAIVAGVPIKVVYNGTNYTLIAGSAVSAAALPANVVIPAPASGTALTVTGGTLGGAINVIAGSSNGSINSTGNASFMATTAYAASFQGVASLRTVIIFTSGLPSGTSIGLQIEAGTNASDYALEVLSQAGANLLTVWGDGGVTIGSPTGGSKGLGTINVASGLYLNGTLYTNP